MNTCGTSPFTSFFSSFCCSSGTTFPSSDCTHVARTGHLLMDKKNLFHRKYIRNIVAAYQGMHVSPAKHSYSWLPRKCDYWTDRQTHRQTDIRQTKWFLCATMLPKRHKNWTWWTNFTNTPEPLEISSKNRSLGEAWSRKLSFPYQESTDN